MSEAKSNRNGILGGQCGDGQRPRPDPRRRGRVATNYDGSPQTLKSRKVGRPAFRNILLAKVRRQRELFGEHSRRTPKDEGY